MLQFTNNEVYSKFHFSYFINSQILKLPNHIINYNKIQNKYLQYYLDKLRRKTTLIAIFRLYVINFLYKTNTAGGEYSPPAIMRFTILQSSLSDVTFL